MSLGSAVKECGHNSLARVAPPATYPYPDGHVCCAFPDRPFEVMPEARCLQANAKAFNWPKWEASNGCLAPPDDGIDRPVCCLTMTGNQVTRVDLLPLRMCIASQQTIPFSWCELYRCVEGPAAVNYPDSSVPGDSSQAPSASRGSTVLFLCAGGALLLFIIITCCYLSCMITVRACFAPPGRRRAPLFGAPWQRDPFRQSQHRSTGQSFRERLAAARRSAAAPSHTEDTDSEVSPEPRAIYVVMPDDSLFIGEKAPSLTHSDPVKSPGGPTQDPEGRIAGITSLVDQPRGAGLQDASPSITGQPHRPDMAQRGNGMLWSGLSRSPSGQVGDQVDALWPGALEMPLQTVWGVNVLSAHMSGVFPVEMEEPWLQAGDVAQAPHNGHVSSAHGDDVELPPLRSGLDDSDTVHDTTVHASLNHAPHSSPFHHSGIQHVDHTHDVSPQQESADGIGWSSDLYGEESEPAPLAGPCSDEEWGFHVQCVEQIVRRFPET